ncbi:MAG TPA: RsmG family class I SAM-dependent methyltransferase, partial [Acidovorax sp.]
MAVNNDNLRQQLQAGADALALGLSDAQTTLLMDFLALLQKWNKVYNLTAVRDPQEMMTHHLLDSLAAVAPLRRHVAALVGEG